ncbi:MAG: polysaccharide biosynthesis protein, partial [Deinococcales bacterium]
MVKVPPTLGGHAWAERFRSPGFRFAAKVLGDLTVLLVTPAFAILIALDNGPLEGVGSTILWATLLLVPFKLVSYAALRPYTQSWSAVTFRDLGALLAMVSLYALFASLVMAAIAPTLDLPHTTAVLDALLTLCGMSGLRAWARFEHERRHLSDVEPAGRRRVLVVGAGETGAQAVRELFRHPETGMHPVGFVDDAAYKQGMRIASVPVLGTLRDIRTIVREREVDEVLIAMPSANGMSVRRVVDLIHNAAPGLRYKIVPNMHEVLSGKVDVRRIRDVDIGDLLGRPPVQLDTDAILSYVEGKRVMITGAGGSIGSELVRQICRFQPAELILFGHGENSIYALQRELDREWPQVRYRPVIGAIQNGDRLDYVFTTYRPQVVFHAAALKHQNLFLAEILETGKRRVAGGAG